MCGEKKYEAKSNGPRKSIKNARFVSIAINRAAVMHMTRFPIPESRPNSVKGALGGDGRLVGDRGLIDVYASSNSDTQCHA